MQSFRTLREGELEYVDESDLIRGLLDRPGVLAASGPHNESWIWALTLSVPAPNAAACPSVLSSVLSSQRRM